MNLRPFFVKNCMDKNAKTTADKQPSESMESFNNRPDNREGKLEEVKQEKDAGESYMDYNGNSETNAPARSREEGA